MKKKLFIIVPSIALLVFVFSCNTKENHRENNNEMHDMHNNEMHNHSDSVTAQYTCPMHPEVISDKEGLCPKCGMDLVLKEEMPMDSTMHDGLMKTE